MTPWDLVGWAVAFGMACVPIAVGVGFIVEHVRKARRS